VRRAGATRCPCGIRNVDGFGLRWQAQRDTAFARTEIFRIKFVSRPPESAVAAPALPAQSKIVHPKLNSGKESVANAEFGMRSAECADPPPFPPSSDFGETGHFGVTSKPVPFAGAPVSSGSRPTSPRPSPPRRGRIVRRLFENSRDWICRTVSRQTKTGRQLFPLLGERIKGEGGRQNKIHSAVRPSQNEFWKRVPLRLHQISARQVRLRRSGFREKAAI